MDNLFAIFISMALINNLVLSKFLGLCPFFGVSKKLSNAISMGLAVIMVMTAASIVSWIIFFHLLIPFEIDYMSTVIFILVIASLVQILELAIKRTNASLYNALGIYLPLITTNCAVLGVAIDSTVNSEKYSFFSSTPTLGEVTVYALGISLGYGLIIFLFSAIREELDAYPIKRNWQGIPIALITAFIMAMIFIGFGGIV